MQNLIEFVDRRNRAEGYALSILWGDRWRYNQFGYERALVQNHFVFSRRFFRSAPKGRQARRMVPSDLPMIHRLFQKHPFRNHRVLRDQRLVLQRFVEGHEGRVWVLEEDDTVMAYAFFFRAQEPRIWGLAEWGGEEKGVMALIGHFLQQDGVESIAASFPQGGDLFREAALTCDEMTRTTLSGMIKILDLGKVLKAFEGQMQERYQSDPLRQSGDWCFEMEGCPPVTICAERNLVVFPGRKAKNRIALKPLDATRLLFGDTPPSEPLSNDEATLRFLDFLFPLEWFWWRSDWI